MVKAVKHKRLDMLKFLYKIQIYDYMNEYKAMITACEDGYEEGLNFFLHNIYRESVESKGCGDDLVITKVQVYDPYDKLIHPNYGYERNISSVIKTLNICVNIACENGYDVILDMLLNIHYMRASIDFSKYLNMLIDAGYSRSLKVLFKYIEKISVTPWTSKLTNDKVMYYSVHMNSVSSETIGPDTLTSMLIHCAKNRYNTCILHILNKFPHSEELITDDVVNNCESKWMYDHLYSIHPVYVPKSWYDVIMDILFSENIDTIDLIRA